MRDEAVRLAEVAVRERRTTWGTSVRSSAAEVGDRLERRRARRGPSSKAPPAAAPLPVRVRAAIVGRAGRCREASVWQRLVAENGAVVSAVTVSRYVARRRVGLGVVTKDVFVPQVHEPGAEAEVDFGDRLIGDAR